MGAFKEIFEQEEVESNVRIKKKVIKVLKTNESIETQQRRKRM